MVLGYDAATKATDVATIFANEFSEGGAAPGVPLRRIDFSGYGASTFSERTESNISGPGVTTVQFAAPIGRTALEVIQVGSVIYPYCIQVVRTITMQRQNAGWVETQPTVDGKPHRRARSSSPPMSRRSTQDAFIPAR